MSMHEIEHFTEIAVNAVAVSDKTTQEKRTLIHLLFQMEACGDTSFTNLRTIDPMVACSYTFLVDKTQLPDYHENQKLYDEGGVWQHPTGDILYDYDGKICIDSGTKLWEELVSTGIITGEGAEPLLDMTKLEALKAIRQLLPDMDDYEQHGMAMTCMMSEAIEGTFDFETEEAFREALQKELQITFTDKEEKADEYNIDISEFIVDAATVHHKALKPFAKYIEGKVTVQEIQAAVADALKETTFTDEEVYEAYKLLSGLSGFQILFYYNFQCAAKVFIMAVGREDNTFIQMLCMVIGTHYKFNEIASLIHRETVDHIQENNSTHALHLYHYLLYLLTDKNGINDDYSIYSDALYALQQAVSGFVSPEWNAQFLAQCLPHAAHNPNIYMNAAVLYAEMNQFDHAKDCIKHYFENSTDISTIEERKQFYEDLCTHKAFEAFRKHEGANESINTMYNLEQDECWGEDLSQADFSQPEFTTIDLTVANRIVEKLNQLRETDKSLRIFGADTHEYKMNPVLTAKRQKAFEQKYGVALPEEYAWFLRHVGNGGAGPFYGLSALSVHDDVSREFPVAFGEYFSIFDAQDVLSDNKMDKLYDAVQQGNIDICHMGCGMMVVIVVNGKKSTVGTTWYYDLGNDAGVFPLANPDTKKPLGFFEWYEIWLDRSLHELETGDHKTWDYWHYVPEEGEMKAYGMPKKKK